MIEIIIHENQHGKGLCRAIYGNLHSHFIAIIINLICVCCLSGSDNVCYKLLPLIQFLYCCSIAVCAICTGPASDY